MQLGDSNGAISVDATHIHATKGESDFDLIGDDDSGNGNNASIEVSVFGPQQYRLAVWESGDNALGTYAVNVELVGTKNRSTPGNLRPSLPAGHNYLPTVPEPVGGDLSDSHSATIGRIQPDGDPATGNIGTTGDEDAFTLGLIGG